MTSSIDFASALIEQYLQKKNYEKTLHAFHAVIVEHPGAALINKRTRALAKANKESGNQFKSLVEVLVSHVSGRGKLLSRNPSTPNTTQPTMNSTTEGAWSASEISMFEAALKMYDESIDKNERFKRVAKHLGSKSKRECYDYYKKHGKKHAAGEAKVVAPTIAVPAASKPRPKAASEEPTKLATLDVIPLGRADSIAPMTKASTPSPSKSASSSLSKHDGGSSTAFMSMSSRSRNVDDSHVGETLSVAVDVLEEFDDFGEEAEVDPARLTPAPLSKVEALSHVPKASYEAVDLTTSKTLRKLLLGDTNRRIPSENWEQQGFFFSPVKNLGYGLCQLKGGPCGVIAPVQALVLKHLLFPAKGSSVSDDWMNPSSAQLTEALSEALTEILWQAGACRIAVVCLVGEAASATRKLDVSQRLRRYRLSDRGGLLQFIMHHLSQFTEHKGPGALLLVYSLMLTRGLDEVAKDVASGGFVPSMIGSHDYASQELVNLILTGVAHSNVFDGTRRYTDDTGDSGDVTVLRGVPVRGQVGFLTLFEHFGHAEVGDFLKSPTHPIWVICSESHYSVVFSPDMSVLRDTSPLTSDVDGPASPDDLDLYYFDPLGRQDEVIRLTLDLSHPRSELSACERGECSKGCGCLIPPLNSVLRTKWRGAKISWNDTTPYV